MNASQIFDSSRFAAVLRRDFTMQRSGWIMRVAAMLATMILTELLVAWIALNVGEELDSPFSPARAEEYALSFLCWFELSVFITLGASLFLSGWSTPGERINEIMSPASTLEKYASRFLISIIGVLVVTLACWELSDLLRELLFSLLYYGENCGHVSFIDATKLMTKEIGSTFVIGFVCSQGIYALGSTLFPRHPFIKTIAAALIIEMIFGFVLGFTAGFFHDASWVGKGHINMKEALTTIYLIAIAITTLFCFITAYYRIKEQEIIERM
ncbi:MAG: hypothetical protein K2L99_06280 [Muribaculaceae bacterium]|nr:hypothetical protein [Muribaculaceae bacterium]